MGMIGRCQRCGQIDKLVAWFNPITRREVISYRCAECNCAINAAPLVTQARFIREEIKLNCKHLTLLLNALIAKRVFLVCKTCGKIVEELNLKIT